MKYFGFITILIALICFTNNSIAQKVSNHIDSVKVYHIPNSIKTVISLDDWDVRNFEKEHLQIVLLTDSISLLEFSKLNIPDSSEVDNNKSVIDVRIVIDIYINSVIVNSIALNNNGDYSINETSYIIDSNLVKWLMRHVPNINIDHW